MLSSPLQNIFNEKRNYFQLIKTRLGLKIFIYSRYQVNLKTQMKLTIQIKMSKDDSQTYNKNPKLKLHQRYK